MSEKEELHARAIKALPGGITRTTVYVPPHPPYVAFGSGCRVHDIAGHVAIDANNNYTALIHGHAHPEIVKAATDAVAAGSSFGLPTRSEVEMAELLSERTGIPHWRFCNSGTEAVMMAIRCARAYTGRELIVRFAGSYHGTSDYVVDPSAPGVSKAAASSVLVLPQGDARALEAAFRECGQQIAAVLIDLMPNRAGLTLAARPFVDQLRRLTRSNGALLVADEVITFRLSYGGVSSLYDLVPDIMTVGKIIGGGFPVGGIGGAEEVLRPFNPRGSHQVGWGGTFSANPVTMNAGRAALQLLDRLAIDRLNERSDRLRRRLQTAGIEPSGHGSLMRVPLGDANHLWWRLFDRGLLVCSNGLMSLSSVMSDADVDMIGDVLLDVVGN